MHVLVLGAGVIGMTTAHALARRGCKVTVIDQANSVAAGASFANGAQLSYSFVDPLASPAMLVHLPAILAGKDPSIRLQKWFDLTTLKWGARFAANCNSAAVKRNMQRALELAAESRNELQKLQAEYHLSFRHKKPGKLIVTRSPSKLAQLLKSAEIRRSFGNQIEGLTAAECFEKYPMLAERNSDLVGGIWAPEDGVGDARRFTEALSNLCFRQFDVEVRLKRRVRSLLFDGDKAVGARTDKGDFTADAVVVCLGSAARNLLRASGLDVQIRGVKGYSITMPANEGTPLVSLTDADKKIVFARLDSEVRIAGLADFDVDDDKDPVRVENLRQMAKEILPAVGDHTHCSAGWAGLRPMTPDGLPITGESSKKSLFLNIGHGMFGWTFAAGSAARLADSLLGKQQKTQRENAA